MSIRFTCTACHTVLKIGEAISEPRKVRCTGCGIVILLTPDEDEPNGISMSIPQQPDKSKSRSKGELAWQRFILLAGAGIVGLLLVFGLWWLFSGPSDRGAIEGKVTLDDGPLESGEIKFTSLDESKPRMNAYAPIVRGRYSMRASLGPAIGKNKVEIKGGEGFTVAARYNTESTKTVEIKLGSNSEDFEVKSK